MLQVQNLSVRFGPTQVLQNLSFAVEDGTSVAIIGPNGVGKSVLLRALIGAIRSEGSVRWATGARIGYVPQKLDLERDVPLTGRDLLNARLSLGRKDFVVDPRGLLESVGLSVGEADRLIGTYSGGQFQRLLIAFALLADPTILLLDEPTAGVDEPGQEQIIVSIRRLQQVRRLTILAISHDLSVVYRYADTVLCLGHHHETFFGPPKEILTPEILEEVYGMPVAFHVP
jgi:zinc transport system ATP-binding protein